MNTQYLQNNQYEYTTSNDSCIITTPNDSLIDIAPRYKIVNIVDKNNISINDKGDGIGMYSTTNLSANEETIAYRLYVYGQYIFMFSAVFIKSNYSSITSNDSVTFTFKSGDTVDTLTYKLYPQYMNTYQIMHHMYITTGIEIYITSTVDITLYNNGQMRIYYIAY